MKAVHLLSRQFKVGKSTLVHFSGLPNLITAKFRTNSTQPLADFKGQHRTRTTDHPEPGSGSPYNAAAL